MLTLEGWESSTGVTAEIDYAKGQMAVLYLDPITMHAAQLEKDIQTASAEYALESKLYKVNTQ